MPPFHQVVAVVARLLLPAVLLLASATGLALLLLGMTRGREVARDDALPFGSFLAIAAYPAWLVMIAWLT